MQQERKKEVPIWSGKVFSSGWVEARGGASDVTDPSNGDLLGLQYPSVKEPRLSERLRKN